MNILFLIFSFTVGGAERLLVDLCNRMTKKGHTVHLCIVNRHYDDSLIERLSPDVRIFKMDRPVGARKKIPYMAQLERYVRENRIEIVHCHGINCVVMSAWTKLRHPNARIFQTVHARNEAQSYSALQRFLLKRTTKKVIAISEAVRRDVLAIGIPKAQTETIYNGVDTDKFSFQARAPRVFSKDDRIEIGCVGRIYPKEKGQDVLLRAVGLLVKEYPRLHCTFAGAVFKGQQTAYDAMLADVRARDLDGNVTFSGNVDDVPAFLSTLDVFVLPSREEGFGIALIEAMAVGIPCVASRLDGPAEILHDARLGLLFTPEDAEDLAGQIRRILQGQAAVDVAAARNEVMTRYDIETTVARHLEVYRS